MTEATFVDQLVGKVPQTEDVASEIGRALSERLAGITSHLDAEASRW